MAFGQILKDLHQDVGASDLNLLEAADGPLEHPSGKRLPSADWRTSQGERINVKSNPFWRSKAKYIGLRGLMIKRGDREDITWAGFVFHASSDFGCSWTYIGKMSRRCLMKCHEGGSSGERVVPFLLALSDEFRWTCAVPDQDALNAAMLIVQPELLMGWCLASSAVCKQAWRWHESYGEIAVRFIEVFLQEPPELPLEFRLWRSLTNYTLSECSSGRKGEVERLLGLIGCMLGGGTAPVCVPRLGGCHETILHRWCTEILEPIRNSYDKIVCPRCRSRNFSLTVSRITDGGAIYGNMVCRDCYDLALKEITIITHCGSCGTYPLILGVNELCSECHGLICNHERESGEVCGACKSCARPAVGKERGSAGVG